MIVKRVVAQLGRALGSGPRGRWFESSQPDQFEVYARGMNYPACFFVR